MSPGGWRSTCSRGRAESRIHLDLRERLPIAEGAQALAATVSSAGDDAGGAGFELGRCHRAAPLVVECVAISFEWSSNEYEGGDDYASSEVPAGIAQGVLRPDGSVATRTGRWRPGAPHRGCAWACRRANGSATTGASRPALSRSTGA